MATYTMYADPGHAWLKVPKARIQTLGLKITSYSYERNEWAYLEEDVDAPTFIKAAQALGENVKIRESVARERSSKIRSYRSFTQTVTV